MLRRFAERKNVKKAIIFCTKAWQPIPTWRCTIIFFALIGTFLVGIGAALIFYAKSIVEIEQRYDDICIDKGPCKVAITIPAQMKQPIYVYYGLDNFYQNHKRFISSRSNEQLKGKKVDYGKLEKDCVPVLTNKDMGVELALDGTRLDPAAPAYPCGALARSFFNDTFQLNKGSRLVPIDENDIAWSFDRESYYKNSGKDWKSKQWINVENEHFIVWMRTSTMPNFKKLWGRIYQDLEPGKYILTIENNYNVSGINGKKSIHMTTGGKLGGKNWLLPMVYISVGGTCILISLLFILNHRLHYKSSLSSRYRT